MRTEEDTGGERECERQVGAGLGAHEGTNKLAGPDGVEVPIIGTSLLVPENSGPINLHKARGLLTGADQAPCSD